MASIVVRLKSVAKTIGPSIFAATSPTRGLTINTGHGALRRTLSAVDPETKRSKPCSAFVPRIARLIPFDAIVSRITRGTIPFFVRVSQGTSN